MLDFLFNNLKYVNSVSHMRQEGQVFDKNKPHLSEFLELLHGIRILILKLFSEIKNPQRLGNRANRWYYWDDYLSNDVPVSAFGKKK